MYHNNSTLTDIISNIFLAMLDETYRENSASKASLGHRALTP